MLDRNACERRVYRLATLLTGDPIAATRVIAQVVDAQPDLRGIDSAHMDRLTVLRSREIKPATLVSDHVPMPTAEALSGLNRQQREAWVLSRVYQAPEREVARAMDCSVTATLRHLDSADEAMRNQLGGTADWGDHGVRAAAAVLEYSLTLDVPGFYRIEQRRRKHARLALVIIAGALLALAVSALLLWWARPLGT